MPAQDFYDAARAVLTALGAPQTTVGINLIVAWMWAEKPHDVGSGWQWNNPMNTTLDAPGAVSMNSVGVKAYPTRQVGAQANADTIRGGYPTLTAALQQGSAAQFFSDAGIRDLSKWVSGDRDARPDYGANIRAVYESISGDAIPPATAPIPAGPLLAATGAVGASSWGLWGLVAVGAVALVGGMVLMAGRRPIPAVPENWPTA